MGLKKYFISFSSIFKQNKNIQRYDSNLNSLIIFIVPNKDTVTGGVISICNINKDSAKLKNIHNSEVISCTSNENKLTFFKYSKFNSNVEIYRLNLLNKYFKNLNNIIIHIPEYLSESFIFNDIPKIKGWLNKIKNIHINILNQNIELMPEKEVIDKLKKYCTKLTSTTAHEAYSNISIKNKYGIPMHHLSAFVSPEQYLIKNHIDKKDIIIVSNDKNEHRDKIIRKLKKELPKYKIIEIKGIKYHEFRELILKAKFAITFGEGLDGYYLEPTFSGTVAFAVFNTDFFTAEYKKLPTIYNSYDSMLNNICNDIKKYDNSDIYDKIWKKNFEYMKTIYQFDIYKKKLKRFYENDFDFK